VYYYPPDEKMAIPALSENYMLQKRHARKTKMSAGKYLEKADKPHIQKIF
jgi:hypothetical protein